MEDFLFLLIYFCHPVQFTEVFDVSLFCMFSYLMFLFILSWFSMIIAVNLLNERPFNGMQ